MSFEDVLEQAIEVLKRRGRVSYRALKRQFELDDAYLEDIKYELIEVHQVAEDQDDKMLIWTGDDRPPLAFQTAPSPASEPQQPPTPSPLGPVLAERRHLTVMFCDLVGSTRLSEQLDPEDMRDLIREYQAVCAKVIRRYDGHIARYFGDGILVYFGYPQAHEDDAQRAVRTGLGIIQAMHGLTRQLQQKLEGNTLQVRIGIHTGLVVAGDIDATQQLESMAIIGDTPNIAARLQGVADPNAMIVSDATYRLIAGYFEGRSLGTHTLKGISEPMAVYQVLHESTAKTRMDVAELAGLTPLVGRERELDLLLERWEQAKAGESHVILLYGEAGIGKSRLVRALKEHISQEPDAWLTECRCSPYYTNSAFYPITDLLERVTLQFERDDTPEEKLSTIEGFLIQYGFSMEEAVPLFASLLSVPFEPRYAPLDLPPDRRKQRTMAALLKLLLLRAEQQPVLFVVEDLHWMDASTLDLITLIIEQAPTYRILTVLTFRPEFMPPWRVQEHIISVPLKQLAHRQARVIIEQMTGGKAIPEEVVEQIVQKTDGIPLFVEELTKTVLESGLLREQETRYALSGPLPPLAIPTTLHDSLIARLDRLATVKEIAQLGAAIAREFEYELIEAVTPLDEATLQAGLRMLVEAGLLYQQGIPPTATYQFKHALIQDAAYESLLKSRRQQYHQRIGQVLERQFSQTIETQPELLAYHYTRANLVAQAIPYWQQAGQRALERAANLEAIAHLTQGLDVLEALSESPERDQMELEMQIALAPAYMAINGWASVKVEQACRRAWDLSKKLGDGQRLFAALWGLWTNYFIRGQMDEALDTAQETLRTALSTDNPALYVAAHHAVGYTYFYRAEYIQTREVATQGLTRFDIDTERGLVLAFQLSSSVTLRMMLGGSLWMLGYPDQATAHVEGALALSSELKHLPTTAYALAASCYNYQPARKIKWVEEKSEELINVCRAQSFLLWLPVGMINHGWAVAVQGHVEEGLAEVKEGLVLFRAVEASLVMPQFMTMLGEVLGLAGQFEEALDALEEGIHEAERRNQHHMEPELYRLKAEILLQRAKDSTQTEVDPLVRDLAEACFERALTLAREQNTPMLALRTAVGVSRHWQDQGRHQEAHQLLSGIYDGFTEGFDTPDLREARTLLENLETLQQTD